MFSLGDSNRYWLYSEPTDMRKSFFTLSGLVIYSKMLDCGRFHSPKGEVAHQITWRDLVIMIEGIIENPSIRRKRLKDIKYK